MNKTMEMYSPSHKKRVMAEVVEGYAQNGKGGSPRLALRGLFEGKKTLPKKVDAETFENYGFNAEETIAAFHAEIEDVSEDMAIITNKNDEMVGAIEVVDDKDDEEFTTMQVRIGSPSGSTTSWTTAFNVECIGDEDNLSYLTYDLESEIKERVKFPFWNPNTIEDPRNPPSKTTMQIVIGSPSGSTTSWYRAFEVLAHDEMYGEDLSYLSGEIHDLVVERVKRWNGDEVIYDAESYELSEIIFEDVNGKSYTTKADYDHSLINDVVDDDDLEELRFFAESQNVQHFEACGICDNEYGAETLNEHGYCGSCCDTRLAEFEGHQYSWDEVCQECGDVPCKCFDFNAEKDDEGRTAPYECPTCGEYENWAELTHGDSGSWDCVYCGTLTYDAEHSKGVSKNAQIALGLTALGVGLALWKSDSIMNIIDTIKKLGE